MLFLASLSYTHPPPHIFAFQGGATLHCNREATRGPTRSAETNRVSLPCLGATRTHLQGALLAKLGTRPKRERPLSKPEHQARAPEGAGKIIGSQLVRNWFATASHLVRAAADPVGGGCLFIRTRTEEEDKAHAAQRLMRAVHVWVLFWLASHSYTHPPPLI